MAASQPITIPFNTNHQLHINQNPSEPYDSNTLKNIQTLFQRARGAVFYINANNELVSSTGWKDWIVYQWNLLSPFGDKNQIRRVRSAIDQALQTLSALLPNAVDQNLARVAAQSLFDRDGERGIGDLSKALYNHKFMEEGNRLALYALPAGRVRLECGTDRFVDVACQNVPPQIAPLNFDLGDETANYNLHALLKRQSGHIFQIEQKTRLVEVTLQDRIPYFLNRKEINKKVQAVVTQTIHSLAAFATRLTATTIEKLVIKSIFAPETPLCRMHIDVFNRTAIEESSDFESVVNPEASRKLWKSRGDMRQALIQFRDAQGTKRQEKRHLEEVLKPFCIKEGKFAQDLGSELTYISDGGSGSAAIQRNRHSDPLYVGKQEDGGPNGNNNPKPYARFKQWVVSPKACLVGNSEPVAEVESCLCDRHFDIWSVPPTEMCYLESKIFKGRPRKMCSVQLFVEGAEPLSKYVNMKKVHWLPRSLVRWYCGGKIDTGIFGTLVLRTGRRTKMNSMIPAYLLELLALHNFLIEDVDCHFENILVKEEDVLQNSVIDRLFRGERPTDEEIDQCVRVFFKEKHHQRLLANLLASKTVTYIVKDGNEQKTVNKRVILVKHDGGASNPHSHPSRWDYLSRRFKHFFEVLPFFERKAYLSEPLLKNRDEDFKEFLIEKAERALTAVLDSVEFEANPQVIPTSKINDAFWEKGNNRRNFRAWIFAFDMSDTIGESGIRKELIPALMAAVSQFNIMIEDPRFYFTYHLDRIRKGIETRVDSYRIAREFLKKPDSHVTSSVAPSLTTQSQQPLSEESLPSLRDLFVKVQSREDFKREIDKLKKDGFIEKMTAWKAEINSPRPVKTPSNTTSIDGTA